MEQIISDSKLTLSRRTLFGTSFIWLFSASLCVLSNPHVLRPVLVSLYLLFIPGVFTTIAISRRESCHDIITLGMLSFIFSLGWLVLSTALLTLLNLSLFFILPLSGLWIGILAPRARSFTVNIDCTKREGIKITAIVLGVLSVLIYPHLLSTRVSLSAHGAFHSSITYNIMQGNIPPTHPGYAGEPFQAYYWTYHVLLASLSETLGLVPVLSSLVLTWTSMAMILVLLYRFTKHRFGFSPPVALLALIGPLWTMSTILPVTKHLFGLDLKSTILLRGRVGLFIEKFITISGFPLGLFLFLGMMVLLFRVLFEKNPKRSSWIGFIVAGVLLFHVHTTTALFAFTSLGTTTLVGVLIQHPSQTVFTRKNSLLVWIPIGALCLPFLFILLSSGGGQTIHLVVPQQFTIGPMVLSGPHVQYLSNARNFVIPFLVAGPLTVLGYGSLEKERPKETRVLGVLLLSLVGFGILVSLPDANQYKAAYMVTLPLVPFATIGLTRLYTRLGQHQHAVAFLFIAILVFNPVSYVVTGVGTSAMASDHNYEFKDTDISLSKSAPFSPTAFEWISNETPTDSSIIVSRGVYDRLNYQHDNNVNTQMIVAALTERSLYYGSRELTSVLLPRDSDGRGQVVNQILSCNRASPVLADTAGPLYVLITPSELNQRCHLSESKHWTEEIRTKHIIVFRYVPE